MDSLSLLFSGIYLFILTSMFSIGLELKPGDIIESFKKQGVLVNALALNLVFVPVAGLAIAFLFGLEGAAFFGFVTMACSPGASYGPRIIEFGGGDVGHSIGLMFLLCMLAVISAPLTLVAVIPGAGGVNPWPVIETLAVIQVVPISLGMFIRSYYPKATNELSAPVFWLSNIVGAGVIVLALGIRFFGGMDSSSLASTLGINGVIAIVLLVSISLSAGYLLGGPGAATKRSMSISTAIRNAGVASLIGIGSFGDAGGLVLAVIIVYIFIQSLMSGVLAAIWGWEEFKKGEANSPADNSGMP